MRSPQTAQNTGQPGRTQVQFARRNRPWQRDAGLVRPRLTSDVNNRSGCSTCSATNRHIVFVRTVDAVGSRCPTWTRCFRPTVTASYVRSPDPPTVVGDPSEHALDVEDTHVRIPDSILELIELHVPPELVPRLPGANEG